MLGRANMASSPKRMIYLIRLPMVIEGDESTGSSLIGLEHTWVHGLAQEKRAVDGSRLFEGPTHLPDTGSSPLSSYVLGLIASLPVNWHTPCMYVSKLRPKIRNSFAREGSSL